MDNLLRETTTLGVEIMNNKRQVKRKLGRVVQFDVNLMLNLSIDKYSVPGTQFPPFFSVQIDASDAF